MDKKEEIKSIKKIKGELFKCFNCGTCSASCPISQISDFNPRKILRKIILGMDIKEDIMSCVTCFTCVARCPNEINIPKLINFLKIQYNIEGVKNNYTKFYKAFLNTVEENGRLYELGTLLKYNIDTGNLFKDAELGLQLMLKGKISIFPHKSKNADAVKKIFMKVREIEKEND